jgi:WD40 repeat protein
VVTRIDSHGRTVQELDAHEGQVRDVVVSPDGTWAVTAGDGPGIFRWDVDPRTGEWSEPEELTGHRGGIVGAEVDATGRRLFTVALDRRVIVWDMSASGGIREDRARRFPFMDTAEQLEEACAVVGRDLSPVEWRRYLPDEEYRPTCSDLP